MKKSYFLVVLAHPVFGRISRLKVPTFTLHIGAALLALAGIAGVGFFSSYTRMLTKVSEFNQMRAEKEALEASYDDLRQQVQEREIQLASLGSLASEVSIAFGIKRDERADPSALLGASSIEANFDASRNQFDFLQSVRLPSTGNTAMLSMLSNTTPSIWPVRGRLSSSFGTRRDPFHGRGAFHGGVDIDANSGTPIVATADGIVLEAGWSGGGHGNRVVLMHGANGIKTLYGHMTEVLATAGQVVRRGEVIGRTGSTGRSTGSHLHYEVRYRGTLVNPYKFMQKERRQQIATLIAD